MSELRKNGYKTVPSGGGHKKIVDHRGQAVVDDNGPLLISSSPGDNTWREKHVARLLRRGVIKRDPWGQDEPAGVRDENRKAGPGLKDPEIRARAQERQDEENRRRAEETKALRARIEPFVAKVGGWDKRGFQSELSQAFAAYGERRGHLDWTPNTAAATQLFYKLRKGGTWNDRIIQHVTLFFDDILNSEDPVLRYVDLVRESKNLPPTEVRAVETGPAVGLPTDRVLIHDKPPEELGYGPKNAAKQIRSNGVGPLYESKLALEVLFEMVHGREEVDKDAVINLAYRVAELETRG